MYIKIVKEHGVTIKNKNVKQIKKNKKQNPEMCKV